MSSLKTASLSEVRQMQERGELLPPKANAPEIDMPDGFWDGAEVVERKNKVSINIRVDADILDFFKASGPGHLTRMNAVLRAYMEKVK